MWSRQTAPHAPVLAWCKFLAGLTSTGLQGKKLGYAPDRLQCWIDRASALLQVALSHRKTEHRRSKVFTSKRKSVTYHTPNINLIVNSANLILNCSIYKIHSHYSSAVILVPQLLALLGWLAGQANGPIAATARVQPRNLLRPCAHELARPSQAFRGWTRLD